MNGRGLRTCALLLISLIYLTYTFYSKLEAEINEKLVDVHNKLLQAGVDQKESEREAKMKETLASLQRIFPGWLRLIWRVYPHYWH